MIGNMTTAPMAPLPFDKTFEVNGDACEEMFDKIDERDALVETRTLEPGDPCDSCEGGYVPAGQYLKVEVITDQDEYDTLTDEIADLRKACESTQEGESDGPLDDQSWDGQDW